MSFYGSYQILDGLRVDKKKFPPSKNGLRFGNVLFVAAYKVKDLTSIGVVDQAGIKIVLTDESAVVVALGPASESVKLIHCKVFDTMYDVTLEPGTHCIVLEGAASIVDQIYSSSKQTSYIPASNESTVLSIFGQTKLLIFKVHQE